jgi:hypothetical protein
VCLVLLLYLLLLKKTKAKSKAPIHNNFFNTKQFLVENSYQVGSCFYCVRSEQKLRSCDRKSIVPLRSFIFSSPMHLFQSRCLVLSSIGTLGCRCCSSSELPPAALQPRSAATFEPLHASCLRALEWSLPLHLNR